MVQLKSSTPRTEEDVTEPAEAQSQQQHVVVVGGGVGGLAVAAMIASRNSNNNVRVTILEKNEHVGGRCGSFWVDHPYNQTAPASSSSTTTTAATKRRRFRHERGPSLLLLPEIYHQLFTEASRAVASKSTSKDYGLDMVQCIPAYQVIFEDGDCISVGFPFSSSPSTSSSSLLQHEERLSREKMDSYERNGSKKWDEYMKIASAYLDCGLPNFIEERLDLKSFPNFLLQSLRDNAKVSFHFRIVLTLLSPPFLSSFCCIKRCLLRQ
jgi:phytoene desaturase (3,4-didehydrolycopene-forming)